MGAERLEKWVDARGSGSGALPQYRFLEPPYGYVIGILLWPVFLSILSVWAVLLQSGLPSSVATIGGLVVGVGGGVLTSMSSGLVMGITAWNTPAERLRRQFASLSLSLPLAVLLFGLYRTWPTIPGRDKLGVSAFAAHELSKIVFLGPAVGFAFVVVPLVVLVHRSVLK